MRGLLLAVLLFPASAFAAGAPDAALTPGRYVVTLKGMLCAVCARAIAAEWAKLPEVESASADDATGSGTLSVKLGKTLTRAALEKALARAERVANLGARFQVDGVKYVP